MVLGQSIVGIDPSLGKYRPACSTSERKGVGEDWQCVGEGRIKELGVSLGMKQGVQLLAKVSGADT